MKKARFTEQQMVAILREADKTPVAEVAKKHKLSEQTIYNWRRHCGTLEPSDIKRLRALEGQDAKLKRILAESSNASLPSVIWRSTPSRRSTVESGELAGAARAGRVRMRTRPVEAACLRAARGSSVGAVVSLGARRARRANTDRDEAPGRAISALRIVVEFGSSSVARVIT
jgi:putative transposase